MTQPSYVPIVDADQVRPASRLSAPRVWRPDRVGDLGGAGQPRGRSLGTPGPDQGYALLVAHELFSDRLQLAEGETAEDALEGAAAVAAARAGLFGRAPVGKDVALGLTLFGFLGGAPAELVAWRKPLFQGAAHHYEHRLAIVGRVPESTLRLAPDAVAARLADWRQLVVTD